MCDIITWFFQHTIQIKVQNGAKTLGSWLCNSVYDHCWHTNRCSLFHGSCFPTKCAIGVNVSSPSFCTSLLPQHGFQIEASSINQDARVCIYDSVLQYMHIYASLIIFSHFLCSAPISQEVFSFIVEFYMKLVKGILIPYWH